MAMEQTHSNVARSVDEENDVDELHVYVKYSRSFQTQSTKS